MKILVTGATGMLGRALVERLCAETQCTVHAAVRASVQGLPVGARVFSVGDLGGQPSWADALNGVEAVIHTAARVHVMREMASDPAAAFHKINVEATRDLAAAAAARGVRRFIFISSVKVNGEQTSEGRPFAIGDVEAPADAYGASKQQAEQELRRIGMETGMEMTVIRPPLVYGPRVGGNFRSMMHWLCRGVPLPLAGIHNRRSLIGLDNLVDMVVTCVRHPAAANRNFFASDGEDLSTPELLRRVGLVMGRPARLFPLPARLLRLAAWLVGKPGIAQRLCDSLQVDISETRRLLGWTPPFSVNEGMRRAVEDWRSQETKGAAGS